MRHSHALVRGRVFPQGWGSVGATQMGWDHISSPKIKAFTRDTASCYIFKNFAS